MAYKNQKKNKTPQRVYNLQHKRNLRAKKASVWTRKGFSVTVKILLLACIGIISLLVTLFLLG